MPDTWENPPYYLTAYAIAVKHGFRGTEEEFVASLHGQNSYLHIKYSALRPERDEDMSDEAGNWIGICADESESAPEHYTAYTWVGLQAGSYLFVRYSDAYPTADSDMSAEPGSGSYWLGLAQSTTDEAPEHYTAYRWSRFRGTDGSEGGDMLKSVYDPSGKEQDIFQAIADTVSTALAALVIGTAKLEDGAVTRAKLAVGAAAARYTVVIPSAGWVKAGTPFTQDVSVQNLGALESLRLSLQSGATEEQTAAFSKITGGEASSGSARFSASEALSVAVPIRISTARVYNVSTSTAWEGTGAPYAQSVAVSGHAGWSIVSFSVTAADGATQTELTNFAKLSGFQLTDSALSLESSEALSAAVPLTVRSTESYTLELSAAWSANGPPWRQSLSVSGLSADDVPVMGLLASGTIDEIIEQREAYANIYSVYAGDGALTLLATEKPTMNLQALVLAT